MADDIERLLQEFRLLKCSSMQPLADGNDPVYITHATVGQETKALATGETTGVIRICELESMAPRQVIMAHKESMTGLEFSKGNENLMWSTSSSCPTMSCWDLRESCSKPAQKLTSPNSGAYTCCGVGCQGDIVAGATEPVGDDVCLYVWDIRSSNPVFTSIFTDSHKEDITQIKFHPVKSKTMASCSTDGLICIYDVSHSQEEDALEFVLNSESSVSQIGYHGDSYNKLYCITHIETLQLWDIEQASLVCHHSDVRNSDGGYCTVEYLIDCFYHPIFDKLYLVAGKHSGDLQVFDVTDVNVSKVCTLSGGHNATVRCLEWYLKGEQIITGGEDSAICSWKATNKDLSGVKNPASSLAESKQESQSSSSRKFGKATKVTEKRDRKPYSRPAHRLR